MKNLAESIRDSKAPLPSCPPSKASLEELEEKIREIVDSIRDKPFQGNKSFQHRRRRSFISAPLTSQQTLDSYAAIHENRKLVFSLNRLSFYQMSQLLNHFTCLDHLKEASSVVVMSIKRCFYLDSRKLALKILLNESLFDPYRFMKLKIWFVVMHTNPFVPIIDDDQIKM